MTSAFSAVLRGSRNGGKYEPWRSFGNAQAERTEPGLENAIAIAVAIVEPLDTAFVPASADQAFDIGFHQDLQHRLRYGSQEIAVAALLQQLDKRHSVFGHRVLGDCWWSAQIHLNAPPGDHLSFTRAPGFM